MLYTYCSRRPHTDTMDFLVVSVEPVVLRPLEIDCSTTYSIDKNLFIGDPAENALVFPWQIVSSESRYAMPLQYELTWEQIELVDIIQSLEDETYQHCACDSDLAELFLRESTTSTSDIDDDLAISRDSDLTDHNPLSSMESTILAESPVPHGRTECEMTSNNNWLLKEFECLFCGKEASSDKLSDDFILF